MSLILLPFIFVSLVIAAPSPSGTFDVLSLNVAGLPEILNKNGQANKTASAMQMGQILSQQNYGVVHVQEVYFPFLSR
jgi:hypothetical protein